jgi:hypothetical protein
MTSGKTSSEDAGAADPDDHPTDPRRLRAVAHPVRITLLELLYRYGPLTASRCAEMLDVTPKVCSYHLTLLAKYGLVEETGGGKGRARPWRLAVQELSYTYRPDEGKVVENAADEFSRTVLARDARIVDAFISRRHDLPLSWRNVAIMVNRPMSLTPAQLRQLGADLRAVLEKYSEASRPDGQPAHSPSRDARPVHLALYAVPVDLGDLTR